MGFIIQKLHFKSPVKNSFFIEDFNITHLIIYNGFIRFEILLVN